MPRVSSTLTETHIPTKPDPPADLATRVRIMSCNRPIFLPVSEGV